MPSGIPRSRRIAQEARRVSRRQAEAKVWAEARLAGNHEMPMPTNAVGRSYIQAHYPDLLKASQSRECESLDSSIPALANERSTRVIHCCPVCFNGYDTKEHESMKTPCCDAKIGVTCWKRTVRLRGICYFCKKEQANEVSYSIYCIKMKQNSQRQLANLSLL
jgi:hypothetical protein